MFRVASLIALLALILAVALVSPSVNASQTPATDEVVLITYPVGAPPDGTPPTGRGVIYHHADCAFLAGHNTVKVSLAELKKDPTFVPCECMTKKNYQSFTRGNASAEDMAKWAIERAKLSSGYSASTPAADGGGGAFAGRVFTPVAYSGDGLEILVETKVTETNDTWWRVSWKLTAKNSTAAAKVVQTATIEFQDQDGFVLDDSRVPAFQVGANSTEVQTGFALVNAKTAPKISKVSGKISAQKR